MSAANLDQNLIKRFYATFSFIKKKIFLFLWERIFWSSMFLDLASTMLVISMANGFETICFKVFWYSFILGYELVGLYLWVWKCHSFNLDFLVNLRFYNFFFSEMRLARLFLVDHHKCCHNHSTKNLKLFRRLLVLFKGSGTDFKTDS